ncbi:GPR endopeptidase [Calorimonas adulescens]|jgi:GPR endopeptidase|uniref:Germination protease n=1 Tax=Calorimonas adulescens TaxID=2606906 RepID=A0A5D8QE80_9THEO|nr:GPR endopeptidase [Calorimonas adulescens]TZE81833.1 GPR endopeptidase [Calorimonas adulescens]
MFSIRTDLAVEARELYKEGSGQEVPGVEVEEINAGDAKVTRVYVFNEVGSRSIGKPVGHYITIEAPGLVDNAPKYNDGISKLLTMELKNLLKLPENSTTLVVGLGNWNVTADSLGPKVVSRVQVTRQIFQYTPNEIGPGYRRVCAIAPGVLGITGIETSDIIKGIVDRVKPDAVIAIDALASRKLTRVNTTIQITDTGINPGSGLGNYRSPLNYQALGIPVIAIGVPTVVDAATVARDAIQMLIDSMKKSGSAPADYQFLNNLSEEQKYSMIREVLIPYEANLVVTPKESDELMDSISGIISKGIDSAIHPALANI